MASAYCFFSKRGFLLLLPLCLISCLQCPRWQGTSDPSFGSGLLPRALDNQKVVEMLILGPISYNQGSKITRWDTYQPKIKGIREGTIGGSA